MEQILGFFQSAKMLTKSDVAIKVSNFLGKSFKNKQALITLQEMAVFIMNGIICEQG